MRQFIITSISRAMYPDETLQDNASAELCNAGDNWKKKRHSGRFVKFGYYWAKIGGGLFLSHRPGQGGLFMQFLCSRDEFGMVLSSVSPFLSAADKIVDFSMSRILKGQSPAQDLKRRQFRRLCAWRSDPWHVAQMLLISEIDRHLLPTFSWRWPTIFIGLYHICNNSFLLRLLV
jgi:hypothetical protein